MAFKLKNKEEKFFVVLNDHAKLCHEAANLMVAAMEGTMNKNEALEGVFSREKEADQLVDLLGDRLRKTFITPMDREDLQLLVEQLDTTIDSIQDIMDKMVMYGVGEPTQGTIRLAHIVEKSLKHIEKSISYMGTLKKNYLKVEARCHEVRNLESEGDSIYHEEMAKLFSECTDPFELIKWKEILNSMEGVIDGCEDLVGTFRRVVLKYA